MLPAICGLDDYFFARFFPRKKIFLSIYSNQKVTSRIRKGINLFVFCLIGKLSYPVVINLFSSRQVMNTSFDPLKLVNTYGAFGSITRERGVYLLVIAYY